MNEKKTNPLMNPDLSTTGPLSMDFTLEDSFQESDWFLIDLESASREDPVVRLEWKESDNAEPALCMAIRILKNCRVKLAIPISADTFALRHTYINPGPGMRKARMRGTPTDKAQIRMLHFMIKLSPDDKATLHDARFSPVSESAAVEGEPVLDRFGQSTEGEWENKVHSEEELITYLVEEYEEAKRSGAVFPPDWSHWGGWMKKRFAATGFFRLEHDGERYWLCDPDGYAFFSNGICYGARCGVLGFTDGLERLHEWLPPKDGAFSAAWSNAAAVPQYAVRNGSEGAEKRDMFNFSRANLIRAFGENWHEAWTVITAARLKKWGFNTIGVGTNDYIDERTEEFLRAAKIPYVITFRSFPMTKYTVFRDFPDVFSPEYRSLCAVFAARELAPLRNDRYLVGYFVTNEPRWLAYRGVNLGERVLAHPERLFSKVEFVRILKEKYKEIAALNVAWNLTLSSFEDLYYPRSGADHLSSEAERDCTEFHQRMVEEYGKIVSEELRRVDPNHLNLGMRYSHTSEKTLGCALDYFNVFSVNCYAASPEKDARTIAGKTTSPVIIGEWHFGAKESELPMYGLCFTETQGERARACRYYAEHSAAQKNIVGIHYFEYNDQPFFGRFDGECYGIGLCDVCHKPYRAVTEAYSAFARRMYLLAAGEEKPTEDRVEIRVRENL